MSQRKPKKLSIQKPIKILPISSPNNAKELKLLKSPEKVTFLPEIKKPNRSLILLKSHRNTPSLLSANPSQNLLASQKERRISNIDKLITECEAEKAVKNSYLHSEYSKSMHDIRSLIHSLDNFKKREINHTNRKKRENEFYITRIEMKKMIDELRIFTKNIV